jgi:hypothetical protein
MTLPLAIRPRIRLRDEPEPPRAARLPPMALPIAVYWGVMGFLSYSVSKSPSSLTSVLAARSEPPAERSEPLPPKLAEAPLPRPLFEPQPVLATAARAPREAEPARETHRSRRNDRRASAHTPRPPLLSLHGDPVPHFDPISRFDPVEHDSFTMRGISALTTSAPAPSEPPPAAVRPAPFRTSAVPSCESAVAAASTEWDLTAARGAPDLSRDSYAAVLENGAYLSRCDVPAGTSLDICAAVQKGRPVGITVVARPADSQVSACVKAAVESLSFPSHPRLDVTRTRFEAVSGR